MSNAFDSDPRPQPILYEFSNLGATAISVIQSLLQAMPLTVARGTFNPEKGRFHFYVAFKPTVDPTAQQRGAERSFPVDVALSITETGELADLAFELPQPCCKNHDSLLFLQNTDSARVIDQRVFVTVPGLSGDSVFEATAKLELDGAGRIIGLEIH